MMLRHHNPKQKLLLILKQRMYMNLRIGTYISRDGVCSDCYSSHFHASGTDLKNTLILSTTFNSKTHVCIS